MTPLTVAGTAGIAAAAAWAPVYYATYAIRSQWLGATRWRGSPERPTVALTFDDGPSDDTPRVLDALASAGVRATFFVVGRQVERFPEIARRIVGEGHEIGNHSYSHPIYLYQSPRATAEEIARTQRVVADVTGVTPVWSRPPCGVRTPAYFAAARRHGLVTVQWSATGFDWRHRNTDRIVSAVLKDVAPGGIVLLHDGDSRGRYRCYATVAAVTPLVSALAARGLRAEPLRDLLHAAAS